MLVFKNGRIFIGLDENKQPKFAEAMGIENGKFVFVGNNNEIEKADSVSIDLQSQIVLPSFIDSHTHPDYVSDNMNRVLCLPPLIHSISEIQEAFKQHKDYGIHRPVFQAYVCGRSA